MIDTLVDIFSALEGGEMKVSRERFQHGSVRKVSRSQGFAWEFRFYLTAPDGKRKLKVQTFDSLKYPTERDVRKAVEGRLSALNAGTPGGKLAAIPQQLFADCRKDCDWCC